MKVKPTPSSFGSGACQLMSGCFTCQGWWQEWLTGFSVVGYEIAAIDFGFGRWVRWLTSWQVLWYCPNRFCPICCTPSSQLAGTLSSMYILVCQCTALLFSVAIWSSPPWTQNLSDCFRISPQFNFQMAFNPKGTRRGWHPLRQISDLWQ